MRITVPLLKPASALVACALMSSCASLVSGTKQEVRVNSSPSGAVVKVDQAEYGHTPTVLTLSAKQPHVVRIELRGYRPYDVCLTQKTNGWIFGNIFFGGLIGIAIDMSTGAAYALTPNDIQASLIPSKGDCSLRGNGAGQISVTLVSKADPNWKRIGQMAKL